MTNAVGSKPIKLATPPSLKTRFESVLLIAIFVLSFVVYISARIVAEDLTDEAFYLQALDENDIYDRAYTELLADPEMQEVSNDLLGNLNLEPSQSEEVSSYAISTLRLVLPPETLQTAIEAAITELLMYFRGDRPRYEASLNLSSTLNDPELGNTLSVYGQTIISELLAEWLASTPAANNAHQRPSSQQIEAFAAELEQFARNLSTGNFTQLPDAAIFIDIRQVPVEERGVIADALLRPVEDEAASEVRNQVEAALAAGDLESAITNAAGELIRPHLETAAQNLQNTLDEGQLDGVKSVAELAEDTEQSVVGRLDLIRDLIVGLREGPIIPLSSLFAILSLATLGWLHAHHLRRAMRIVGGTLIGSSMLLTGIFLAISVVIAAPLENFTDIDPLALPPSLRNMMNDVLASLISGLWSALWNRTAVVFVAGVILVLLTYLPGFSRSTRGALAGVKTKFENVTGISLSRPRNAFAVTIAVILLTLILSDLFFSGEQQVSAAGRACNGHAELCDRPIDEVVFAATHNSMSISSLGWVWPTHDGDITAQLEFGIRGFLIDTHYWDTEAQITAYMDDLPPEMKPVVEDLIQEQSMLLQDLSREGVFTCHGLCLLGATPLVNMLAEFRTFLEANPNEVLVFIIQDTITAADTEAALREAGLLDYTYAHPRDLAWPTLGELIDRDQRLVVMAEEANPRNNDAIPDWYLYAWDYVQENPFSMINLENFGCDLNRGSAENDLFLLNHWIDRVSPSRVDAARVNSYDFLMNQARQCEAERGQIANFIAVNFYAIGDLIVVVNELNGVAHASE